MAIVATTIVYHFEYKWQCVNNMYLYKWDNFNQLNKKNDQDSCIHKHNWKLNWEKQFTNLFNENNIVWEEDEEIERPSHVFDCCTQ